MTDSDDDASNSPNGSSPHAPRPFLATIPKLAGLLIFLPVAIVMQVLHLGEGVPLFVVSALGILGTVTLIGKATEEVAVYAGPVWGGLLNATFGNVTELIIAIALLRAGPDKHEIVRSSITGSILGNLLLVLGAAMVYGGTKFATQSFSRTSIAASLGMLTIAVAMLIVPSLMPISAQLDELDAATADRLAAHASMTAAIILLGLYGLSLVFSLRTHRFLLMPQDEERHPSEWSLVTAATILFLSTCVVAYLSEVFVHAINHLKETGTLPVSELFVGVIIVAIVGNAAEGTVAIFVAGKGKMEFAIQIAMGSGLQVAMMVAPVLVLASFAMGTPMTLAFNPFELLALVAGVAIASNALSDGESNWFEGTMFLGVYLFFALVFWFHP
jgi:Ca2+:H+ antiporter